MAKRVTWIGFLLLVGLGVILTASGNYDATANPSLAIRNNLTTRGLLSKATITLQTLRLGLSHGGPRTFNPAYARDPESRFVSSLLSLDLLSAAAAISWKADESGGSHLTIKLRPDLRWSDDTSIIATDWVDAVREIYLDPRADTVYRILLESAGVCTWLAADPTTIQISSAQTVPQDKFLRLCAIPPQPMAKIHQWRKLGQPGSLGTGLRSIPDYQYYGFIDSGASEIISSGNWQVAAYRPGNSLDLIARDKSQTGLFPSRLHIDFFSDIPAFERAFTEKAVDLMPTLGRKPNGFTGAKVVALGISDLVVSLLINPVLVKQIPWLFKFIDQGINRQEWCTQWLDSFSVPERTLWQGNWEGSAEESLPALAGNYLFEVRYDKFRSDRGIIAGQIHLSDILAHCTVNSHAVPSTINDMVADLAYSEGWQMLLLTIDKDQDSLPLLQLLDQKMAKLGEKKSKYYPIIPLFRPVALAWANQDLAPLPKELEKSFLAYAVALR